MTWGMLLGLWFWSATLADPRVVLLTVLAFASAWVLLAPETDRRR
jgi:hypothetical protein